MPFKSKAQKAKFGELVATGKISSETYMKWEKETGKKRLPEKVAQAPKKVGSVKTVKKV